MFGYFDLLYFGSNKKCFIITCVICKTGNCKPGKNHFRVFVKDAFIVVKHVDALICENCGEAYYDAETTKRIQQQVELAYNKNADVAVVKI